MNTHDFHDFLDHPDQLPQDPTELELATMLKELSQETIPDPGTDYWNQFNHRLQLRLQEPKLPFWKQWFKPGVIFFATALVLVVAMPFTLRTSKPDRTLASLSSDSLIVISEMFDSDLWDPLSPELADSELDHLIETTDTLFEDSFPAFQFFDSDGWDEDLKHEG